MKKTFFLCESGLALWFAALVVLVCASSASAQDMDYGDAPSPYPTVYADNGARHISGSSVYLGSSVDIEADGQPDSSALGDDNDGNDDEDGVTFESTLVKGEAADVTVTASTVGFLNAWLDFNGDGDWDDAGEQIFTSRLLFPGKNDLIFAIPTDATSDPTCARFRFSLNPFLSYNGEIPGGEVEDYQVTIGEGGSKSPDPLDPTIDLQPNTLNLRSKGKWLTCYIELPEGYDVNDINVSTVKLLVLGEEVSAEINPTEVDDYDDDGISDLMVKFDRQALIEYLDGATGDVTLRVKGEVAETPFEGEDTITVVSPGK